MSRRIFHVYFKDGMAKSNDYQVIAEDAIKAIIIAQSKLERDYKACRAKTDTVWASQVFLTVELTD